MSNRLLIGIGLLLVAAGSIVLILQVWPLAQKAAAPSATLLIEASNAGMALSPEDGAVSVYLADPADQLMAEGAIGEPLVLAPGRYDIQVRFSRTRDQQTQWLRNIELIAGDQAVRQVEFAAGEINVEATVGSADSEAGQVIVYVFRPGEHDTIVTAAGPGEPILLGAGNYDLRVVWSVDSGEKDVRWYQGIQVRVGLQTKLNVPFDRGVLAARARNAGAAMDPGTVSLTVYRAGDEQLRILDSGLAGVPLGLASGSYDIEATYLQSTDKPSRWLRGLEINDGEILERWLDFSSGTLAVKAALEGGTALKPFEVYIYYYRADDHQQAIAYTPAGTAAVLESGTYDVRARFYRSHDQPDIWLRNLTVNPGETLQHSVSFRSGKLLVRAYDQHGTELFGDSVFVYIYGANEHSRPITTVRSGELVTLTEGVYDIRATDTRSETRSQWLRSIRLKSGSMTEQAVTF